MYRVFKSLIVLFIVIYCGQSGVIYGEDYYSEYDDIVKDLKERMNKMYYYVDEGDTMFYCRKFLNNYFPFEEKVLKDWGNLGLQTYCLIEQKLPSNAIIDSIGCTPGWFTRLVEYIEEKRSNMEEIEENPFAYRICVKDTITSPPDSVKEANTSENIAPSGFLSRILGGAYKRLFVQGDYCYTSAGERFMVLDVSDPTKPVEAGHCYIPGMDKDICVEKGVRGGNFAYLVKGNAGLYVVDVTDPFNPKIAGHYESPGKYNSVYSVHLEGAYAFLNQEDDTMIVLDVSDAENPRRVGELPGSFNALVFKSDTAFQICGNILIKVDISIPTSPAAICTISTQVPCRHSLFDFTNGLSLRTGWSDTILFIEREGITTKLISKLGLPRKPLNFVKNGQYIFAGLDDSGLVVISMKNPTEPTISSYYQCEAILSDYGKDDGEIKDMFISDSKLYLASDCLGIRVLDINDPDNLSELGSFKSGGYHSDYQVQIKAPDGKSYVYVASGDDGCEIIDVTDPQNPEIVSVFNEGGYSIEISVIEPYAYVADESRGLCIYDVSNKYSPIEIGVYECETNRMDVSDNGYAYLRNMNRGFHIVDVIRPAMPAYKCGVFDFLNVCYDIEVISDSNGKTDYVFFLEPFGGVYFYEFSTPEIPKRIGGIGTLGMAYDLVIKGDYLFVSYLQDGFEIIDVSDLSSPERMFYYDSESNGISGLSVDSSYIYFYEDKSVKILDWSDPSHLKEINSISLVENRITDSYIDFPYAYFLEGDQGVHIYDVTQYFDSKNRQEALEDSIKKLEVALGYSLNNYVNQINQLSQLYLDDLICDTAEAMQCWESFSKIDWSGLTQTCLIYSLGKKGEYQKAVEFGEEARKSVWKRLYLYEMLAEMYIEVGEYNKAMILLDTLFTVESVDIQLKLKDDYGC